MELTTVSDGALRRSTETVLSIAATLLVFNLALRPPGTPQQQLRQAWPGYLGYAISFLTIGAAWLAHNAMTERLTGVDSLLLRLNLVLLLVVAFLPFPTKLVADSLRDTNAERNFVTVFGITLLTIRLLIFALDAYARRARLYSYEPGDALPTEEHRNPWPVVVGYVVAILIGLVAPTLAVVLYFALALYLVVPFRDVRRLLTKHS